MILQLMACKAYFDLGEIFKCYICEDTCLLTGKTLQRTILCQPHSPVIFDLPPWPNCENTTQLFYFDVSYVQQ